VFEYRGRAHVFKSEDSLVGNHEIRFAVQKLAIQLRPVAEDNQNMGAFAEVMVQHETL